MAIASTVGTVATGDQEVVLVERASVMGLEAAEAAWRHLETTGVCTPCHRFDWMAAWDRNIGRPSGAEPAVVVATDPAGAPVMVLPFVVRRSAGLRAASWMGGRFANYQIGLFAPHAFPLIRKEDLATALAALHDERKVDVLHLINQPYDWGGQRNPFLSLPNQPAPSDAYSLAISGRGFDELYTSLRSGSTRKKLRRAERGLVEDFGGCTIRQPATELEAETALDVFFHQKRERLAASSTQNVFDTPGVEAFLRDLARLSLATAQPLLDLYWLQTGTGIAAVWAGARDGRRLSGLINSFDTGEEIAALHPGELLLRHVIERACRHGIQTFDLGTGDAPYKRSWCPDVDELFETHLALSGKGLPAAAAAAAAARVKRRIKRSPQAMKLVHRFGFA